MYNREMSYRIYLTDALKLRYGLDIRWIDWIKELSKPDDTRTKDDIIAHIASNANVTMNIKSKEAG